MIRRPPRSTLSSSSAASDVYKRQFQDRSGVAGLHIVAFEGSIGLLTAMLATAQHQKQLSKAVSLRTAMGYTPLHMAASGPHSQGRLLCAESLVMCSADLQVRCDAGLQPLHMAARQANSKVCRFLVSSQADVNAMVSSHQTRLNLTPLHLSAQAMLRFERPEQETSDGRLEWFCSAPWMGGLQCSVELLQLGADLQACAAGGWTPLLIAAHKGCYELTELLMRLDPAEDYRSHTVQGGWTALHLAVLSQNSMLCNSLLMAGLEPDRQAVVGMSADKSVQSYDPHRLATELAETDKHWEGVLAVLRRKSNPDDPVEVRDQKITRAFQAFENSGFGRRVHRPPRRHKA
eukprot:TRINITY_DN61347_c0_g1_i1.p1 TRINITY_DN61347_c0_g1~~TRINITY_DN61347_c0_g1_i1.p1  ORF type:complete len:347 (+),score=76.13 TRINITY_DN61347_c0_g1_i1:95-1135(+)